jgi:hypothetical protein
MASPTGFIDFDTFYASQGASEEEAQRRKLDELQRLDDESARHLRLGEGEAEMANLAAVRGGGQAGMGLSQTGSYGQYLKAQQQAKSLRAQLAMAAQGVGTAGLGARAAARTGSTGAAEASAKEQQRLRDFTAQRTESGRVGYNEYAAQNRQRAEAAADAEKARTSRDEALFDTARGQLTGEMDAFWANADKRSGTFGFGPEDRFMVWGHAGPADDLSAGWKNRAAGLGMKPKEWQTQTQEYTWGKRNNAGKEGK